MLITEPETVTQILSKLWNSATGEEVGIKWDIAYPGRIFQNLCKGDKAKEEAEIR
jgi:hypothetical protein